MHKIIPKAIMILILLLSMSQAQFATIGGGVLVSERPLQPVAELNIQTAPFFESRAYVTSSWTDESSKPTIISAVERSILQIDKTVYSGIGIGLLWLEFNDYNPKAMLVSSSVFPLPIPRASLVMIGSVLPFEDYEWSLVFKVGWAFWSGE